jgi:flagellar basal body-associated protein FliL
MVNEEGIEVVESENTETEAAKQEPKKSNDGLAIAVLGFATAGVVATVGGIVWGVRKLVAKTKKAGKYQKKEETVETEVEAEDGPTEDDDEDVVD